MKQSLSGSCVALHSWVQDQPWLCWELYSLLLVKVKLQQGLGMNQLHHSSATARANVERNPSSGQEPRVQSHPCQSKAKKIGLVSAIKLGKILL